MPIPWLTEEVVWVPQWPLSSEKLEAATKLISEQLRLGHLGQSTSPWNTPIFVIKKNLANGAYYMILEQLMDKCACLDQFSEGYHCFLPYPKIGKL